jgi:hypothetical protein
LCEKMFQRSPSSVGHVEDEHNVLIERTITRQPIPIETEETWPQSRLKPKMSRDSLPATR